MQQAGAFLRIRVRQALREVLRSGPVYGSVLVFAVIGAFLFFYFSQKNNHYIVYTYAGLLVLLLSVHMQRSDHRFVKLIAIKPYLIYFSEYATFLFPFFLITIIKSGQFFQMFSLIPVALISILKVNAMKSQLGKFPVFFTGTMNFEWKAGLRKTGWVLVMLWFGAMLITPIPYASVLLLWFMLLIVSSFYESDESRSMVEAFEVSERKLLWMKMRDHSLLFTVIILPVLFISALFFPQNWWISLFFICFSMLNIAVFVVSKYAVWGHEESHGSATMMNTFCLVGFFLPFLLPLPFFVLVRNYFRAKNQLKPLLHAYA